MVRKTLWRIWIDTGGTFTDGIAVSPQGDQQRVKILTSSSLRGRVERGLSPHRLQVQENWSAPPGLIDGFEFRLLGLEHPALRVESFDPQSRTLTLSAALDVERPEGLLFDVSSPEEAPLLAARLLTRTPGGVSLPASHIRLATTLGTNALLQRAGVPTALFITRGFGDLLRIGTQQRPDLFALAIDQPEPLYREVVEVDERLDAAGRVVRALDPETLRATVDRLVGDGLCVAAVALAHAYRNATHERRLRDWLQQRGFTHVSCSSELTPSIKLLPRAQTAVVDAYLDPVVRRHLDRVRGDLPRTELLAMTSAGGLLDPGGFRAKDSLLSGPAGGVVGAAQAGLRCGRSAVISFDMGGTSTDVARFDGDYEYLFEHRVGDALLVAPALAIESVAAGGGSICWADGERLRVGPQSAGAFPGPACYGAGGPLTLTDVNVLLGRLDVDGFEIPTSIEPARARFEELRARIEQAGGERAEPAALLEGLLAVANETMADAIRRVSLRRGYDPVDYTLVCFGGAGGQHACAVAERLGITQVLLPVDAALLSAQGLGFARVERFVERQILQPLAGAAGRIADGMAELGQQAAEAVEAAGVSRDRIEIRRRTLQLRFVGQESGLEVEWDPDRAAEEAFAARYRELYGHAPERREVELVALRVAASSIVEPPQPDAEDDAAPAEAALPRGSTRCTIGGAARELPLFDRAALRPGQTLAGPVLVRERHSSLVLEPGWTAVVKASGSILLRREPATTGDRPAAGTRRPESILIELFTQRFTNLVREMGERLERTAVSTNVKERLDFSCALLDPTGRLVVNAPHIPVHLGALGLCVRRIMVRLALGPGDVVVSNHPAFGGSHLPDVTVLTPVFADGDGGKLLGFVANRAHHAEIGGNRPGSMPPAATRLAEEGVVIPPDYLVRHGRPRWEALRRRLLGGPFPTRGVEDNLADLRAAVAANHAGEQALIRLGRRHGADTLLHYMARLQRLAEQRIRAALRAIPDGRYAAREQLDDGTPLCAAVEIEGDAATVDFSGTGDVHAGNLNVTPAIVHSAVLYVLRLLLREPLPLNEGLLRAVTLVIPRGLLDPPFPDDPTEAPAVVGGNVETSQRLVDTLIKALGLAACSQGTMNNLIFGNERYGYYETLGGGGGAGPGFHGAHAVHTHMTNTRITDPEVLEHRYPVRVERFAIRRGSGGEGRFRGGDGLVRELTFLEPVSLSILSQHRVVAPFGLQGGGAGRPGTQHIVRADGRVEPLGGIDGREVEAGDRVVVETPGGGGYGTRR